MYPKTLAAPLSLLPAQAWRSPAGFSPPLPPPRHRAAGIPRGSTTSAARWNGERKDVIDTVRVTEYGSAAGLQHWKDRLHQPRDLISLRLWIYEG
jgi:hypothetical protein